MRDRDDVLSGQVLDEHATYNLRDVCRVCGVHAELVIDMVTEGLVTPRGAEPRGWYFSGVSVVRIQTALRLQRDLGVNLAGAALALELLEEIDSLRRSLRGRLTV